MAQTYLKLEKLSVGYGTKVVIGDIDLDIHKGEVISLIGPNGAGKSTILKTLSKQLPIISGRVVLDGIDLNEYSYRDLSKKMAVVLTEKLKTELMTCRDIVSTGRYPYTGKLGVLTEEDDKKVEEAMRKVNAYDLRDKDFTAISDGQRQRVLLARAICQEPQILLLDEPTSFLDVKYKLDLLSILTAMAREKNITVIMSLHEIDLAEKVSDRIISVRDNSMFCCGEPEEVFEEETIRELYDIDNGFFDPLFGSIELAATKSDAPEVFVISGDGLGIPVYRKLQKDKIPFAAGILYRNDMDYRLARLLASEVVSEVPNEPISEWNIERAKDIINGCGRVIIAMPHIGENNQRLKELIDSIPEEKKEIV